MTAAIMFDLDGVIVDTEQVWDEVREELVADWGGRYSAGRPAGDDGHELGRVVTLHARRARPRAEPSRDQRRGGATDARALPSRDLPLIEGAVDVVRDLSRSFPLAVASSSNRSLIDTVLETAGIAGCFSATVSSEEVERGKPSPDVYLEPPDASSVVPQDCVAVEDSANGIRAAAAAGMRVIAFPNLHFPPGLDALDLAAEVIGSLADLPGLMP